MSRSKDPGRRAALLDAGRRVLSARGVSRTTIDEVTAAAGVAKGTFYLYFRSKDELIASLRRQFAQRLSQAVGEIAGTGRETDWQAVTFHLVEAAVDGYLGVAPRYEAVLGQPACDPDDEDWADEIIDRFSDFLARGTTAGAFAVDDPRTVASLLFHALHGTCHRSLVTGAPTREQLIGSVRRLFTGIFA